jgi:antirestriction protein ArdC
LTHAVGHPSRLNRPTLTDPCRFGDPTYAKEELVAEMGSAYLCGVCGIAHATIDASAAYLQSWMAVLRHDTTLLVHAAAQAQRAAEYIQNLHPAPGAEDGRAHGLTR